MRRVLALAAALALAGCVGPARTFDVYESRAFNSVESALSAVQSTRMAIRDAVRGDALAAYVAITIQNAEETASTAQGHFDSIQPPDERSDQLRTRTSERLGDAVDLIARARIAARRTDVGALRRLDPALKDLAGVLDRVLQNLEP